MSGVGRPPYKITDADYGYAVEYLLSRHKSSPAYRRLKKCLNAQALQIWCDGELVKDEFEKLKVSIRLQRKRSKDAEKNARAKQITISLQAWKCLKELAEAEGMTFSEVICNYLGALNECSANSRKRFIESGKL